MFYGFFNKRLVIFVVVVVVVVLQPFSGARWPERQRNQKLKTSVGF